MSLKPRPNAGNKQNCPRSKKICALTRWFLPIPGRPIARCSTAFRFVLPKTKQLPLSVKAARENHAGEYAGGFVAAPGRPIAYRRRTFGQRQGPESATNDWLHYPGTGGI